jgi:alkylation response protein AidB-like acyl-CoA dehydrogenase
MTGHVLAQHREHGRRQHQVARLYADARVTRIFGGTSEVMKLIISRTLTDA